MKKGLIVFLLILAGCSPGRLLPGLTAHETVEWVDVVMWNDSLYAADYEMNELDGDWEVGKELGEVIFKMADHANSKYKMKNGDATYLPIGTKIHEMKGYDSHFRVVADGKIYEIDRPENAKHLSDFLDIEGKVKAVHFLSDEDGSLIGEMSHGVQEQFVNELLALDYDADAYSKSQTNGYRVFIQIVLTDGTTTRTSYWPESRFIWYGAIASDSLEELLAKELFAHGF